MKPLSRFRLSRSRQGLLLWSICAAGFACTPSPEPPRDIIVVARGMTFLIEGAPEAANPVIQLRAGERVRLVLRNEAPGLLHDLVIPDLGVEIEQVRAGESRELTFTAPVTPGRHEYRCRPHAEMMHGIIDVTP